MGMAASQARYLALVARKSNCEYEGQQINQSRLILANQTANLFNQMLGLKVPVPPSTQDFTILQYSFTDGINPAVIDKWEQLATPDDDGYDYVVEYHYDANVYKGFQKKMNDPQVQFSYHVPSEEQVLPQQKATVDKIYAAQKAVREAQAEFDTSNNKYQALLSKAKSLVTYRDRTTYTSLKADFDDDTEQYILKTNDEASTETVRFSSFKDVVGWDSMIEAEAHINDMDANQKAAYDAVKAWMSDGVEIEASKIYFSTDADKKLIDNSSIALVADLEDMTGQSGNSTTLPVYNFGAADDKKTEPYTIYGMQAEINKLKDETENKLTKLQQAESDLEAINMPKYLGNTELESLGTLDQEELAELKQVIRTMNEQGVDTTKLLKCFENSLNLTEDNYIGGIYKFERDGVVYYTTYYDLADTAIDSEFMNDIDNQPKLNYYHANYVKESIYTTDKAVLDTDSVGRFKTVRFKDGAQYTLTVEEKTDDAAYQDAMNQYTYKAAEYDKMIQDINAKTSLIHQQDQQLELKLKQLDTEQNALSNEIEAVSKVVKDNVEKSFKTFGG